MPTVINLRTVFIPFLTLIFIGISRPAYAQENSESQSGIEEPVSFSATDSVIIQLKKPNDQAQLTGEVKVGFGSASLDAWRVRLVFSDNELHAEGFEADTGIVGRPALNKDGESFTGFSLAYNLDTEKGRLVQARTQFEDGFLLAGISKIASDSVIFVDQGKYTTCSLDHPHYHLRASRMKVVNQNWIYTGPIHLRIFNIPMPLWLPFGFLPATQGRRSGPLSITYGEDSYGFYLQNVGWYFALNDYTDFQISGGFWTQGNYQLRPTFRYNKRYKYNGTLGLTIIHAENGEENDPDFSAQNTYSLNWTHKQELSPTASINGNVNLKTNGQIERALSSSYQDQIDQSASSSLTFSKRWPAGRRSLNLSARQNQNFSSNKVSLTLPSLTFTQQALFPFKQPSRGGTERWFEKINFRYTGSLNNSFDYTPLSDSLAEAHPWYQALVSADDYLAATGNDTQYNFKTTHNIPLSASFTFTETPLLKKPMRLTVTPSIRYTETWFIQSIRRSWDKDNNTLKEDKIPGFASYRHPSLSLSANTEIYGTFPIKIGDFLDGVRHTIRPTVSFTYAPDETTDFWGYQRSYFKPVLDTAGVQIDSTEQFYSIFPNQSIQQGLQQRLSLSFSNVWQARIVKTDTTGEKSFETIKLFSTTVSGFSYNFAADSMQVGSTITISNRVNQLFGKYTINLTTQYATYAADSLGRNTSQLLLLNKQFPLRFTSARFSLSTSFKSKQGSAGRPVLPTNRVPTQQTAFEDQLTNPDPNDPFAYQYSNTDAGYADFDIPWSVRLGLTYNYKIQNNSIDRVATTNASFDFSLTPNWKVTGSADYDFITQELSKLNLGVTRDLHCWQLAFNWTPVGIYQAFSFNLQVKSGHLRDILKLDIPKSDVANPLANF